ncbi:MAG: cobyrinate a,c-diamide synthase, partial [Candidatus Korobacteraceae bacterium]
TWTQEQVNLLADAAQRYIDLDLLLAGCDIRQNAADEASAAVDLDKSGERVRIGVARDQAFSFYYESSLDALRAAGAELIAVSPLSDAALPPELDGLYLGGGYPEVFAEELAQNQPFLASLREFAAGGGPIYAECGGLMYLAEDLTTCDGRRHMMAAVLPLSVEMLNRLDGFGYTEVEVLDDCLIGPRGTRLRGHSFHHSHVIRAGNLDRRYRTQQVLTGADNREGYCAGNILASYIHLSFAASPQAAVQFVRNCRQAKAVAS